MTEKSKKNKGPIFDEHGNKISKSQLKKRNKKKTFKRMFIQGKAVFIDFRDLLQDHSDFLGNPSNSLKLIFK